MDQVFSTAAPLKPPDIAPGAEVSVDLAFDAPTEPGDYRVHVDLAENASTYFSEHGSPVATCDLTVVADTRADPTAPPQGNHE